MFVGRQNNHTRFRRIFRLDSDGQVFNKKTDIPRHFGLNYFCIVFCIKFLIVRFFESMLAKMIQYQLHLFFLQKYMLGFIHQDPSRKNYSCRRWLGWNSFVSKTFIHILLVGQIWKLLTNFVSSRYSNSNFSKTTSSFLPWWSQLKNFKIVRNFLFWNILHFQSCSSVWRSEHSEKMCLRNYRLKSYCQDFNRTFFTWRHVYLEKLAFRCLLWIPKCLKNLRRFWNFQLQR